MTTTAKALFEQAMKLSTEERAALAEDLLASLDEGDTDFDAAAHESAWNTEIARRMAETERDPSRLLDGEKVFDEMFAMVGGKRPR